MPMVRFTRHLTRFFPELQPGEVPGATVREVVDALEAKHPGFASFVTDDTGRLRRHVNVFVGNEPIYDRESLSDEVAEGQEVFILQALSGG